MVNNTARMHVIAAVASNGIIGVRGGLPWRIPEDLAYFKRMTSGCVCVVGQTTYRDLPPLRNRTLVVVSRRGHRTIQIGPDGRAICVNARQGNTLAEALDVARWLAGDDAAYWIIGGAQLYAQTIPMATELHITHVHDAPAGDTRFPRFDLQPWDITVECSGSGWTRNIYRRTTDGNA